MLAPPFIDKWLNLDSLLKNTSPATPVKIKVDESGFNTPDTLMLSPT